MLGKQSLRRFIVLLDQFAFVHSDELTFFDDELSADYVVIHADGLTEDNCRDGIVHPCEFDAIEVHGEEVGAFANFERADVFSSKNRRAAASSQIQGFSGSQ